jgi:hypothetical protein
VRTGAKDCLENNFLNYSVLNRRTEVFKQNGSFIGAASLLTLRVTMALQHRNGTR